MSTEDLDLERERIACVFGLGGGELHHIEPVSLSRLETGDRALSLSKLGEIADALDLGLGALVGVEGDLPKPDLDPQEAELLRALGGLTSTRKDLLLRLARELAE